MPETPIPTAGDAAAEAVRIALGEDLGGETLPGRDITSAATIPSGCRATGRFVAREPLVLAGTAVAREVFRRLDPSLAFAARDDGGSAGAGDEIATVRGDAQAILAGERTALNFLQRLSGVATMTRRAVDEVAGTRCRILDTRKTTPGLRALEKAAVLAGGGTNHRFGLADAVLVKDNHVAIAGGVREAIEALRRAGIDPAGVTIEVDDAAGAEAAVGAGAGRILLDNFTPERAAAAIARIRALSATVLVECSGGLVPGRLRPFAEAGADFLSLGCLTHSARAMDIALDIVPDPAAGPA